MPISPYLRRLRDKVGGDLLLIPSVTAILYDADGRILLARHAEGDVWVAPGGAVEPHESATDAVVREVVEETALAGRPIAIVGGHGGPAFLVTYGNGDRVSYLMTVFECVVTGGEMRPDGQETLELRYLSEADLEGRRLAGWAPVVLKDAFRRLRGSPLHGSLNH